MRRFKLILLFFLSLTILPDQAAASLVGALQQAGVIAIYAPSGPDVSTTSTNFVDMPQMKGAVTLSVPSNLAMTLCAEASVTSGQRMFVRALLDDLAAFPDDVVFASSANQETHCFTFVSNSVAAGVHAVRLQWLVDSGGTAFVGDRNLHITFAQASADELNLLAVAAPSGPDVVITGGWVDIPNMSGTLQLLATSDLAITFSAEADTTSNARLFLRALVDGAVAEPDDEVLVIGAGGGTRNFTFVKRNVGAGSHNIRIQGWVPDPGQGLVGDRTLKVMGVRQSNTKHVGGLMVAAPSGPPQTTSSTDWVNVPNLSGTLNMPAAGDIAIGFSAEIWATNNKRVFIRALLDGQPTNPDDVRLTTGGWSGSFAYTFVARTVSRGSHTIQLQWLVDAGGEANVADRTLSAYSFAKQQPAVFVGIESGREPGYPYGGCFADTVVDRSSGTDPCRAGVFKPYVRQSLFGAAYPSIADYYLENSDGRFFLVEAGLLGPYKYCDSERLCRADPNWFGSMITGAWQRADASIDFSLYDRNGDSEITWDEVVIVVIIYQDTTAGYVRGIPDVVSNDGVILKGTSSETACCSPHFYTNDFVQPVQTGVIAHELAHEMINAGDMYEDGDPTRPGVYSLMDQHFMHPHLDPQHKLRAGNWFDPITITRDGYYDITAVEQQSQIDKLRDPARPNEYFLVESRQQIGYDRFLPDSGLAIWHIDETLGPDYWRKAVELMPAGTPNALYNGAGSLWGKDFWDNSQPYNARWHDGTPSRIGVWAIHTSGTTIRVFLDVPGPGALVDMRPELLIITPGQETVYQVRLVNTGLGSDTFTVSTDLPSSWVTWSENPMVTLAAYEQRIIGLTVKPTGAVVNIEPAQTRQNQTGFSITVRSNTNVSVITSRAFAIASSFNYLPLIIR